ncbi:UDP-N-acetylmuramoyl-tripeptide--D-alanyl-D-alanine ligase [Psychrobacter phenylpyruvicus]|uniref:UDP-N-acetylmuramoyl-tripeptide--D-alanyl-D-alanine ligase n=1 Tax=Psychrobacter phenylpyruvicus TaxID=29432 RepID=A0A379LMV2_9GAMM|nr:UDP-N-acetylmuramoyl-tripeptide--D-alanyl-D-alanine ligase [Psychrobacter phenylpyruvicus]SUD91936.1 UDP-N-acetylmuramoyl-tripeptide--D-alanyl-D-alanine ligase [Psychrobacter phenylpyruvicus]
MSQSTIETAQSRGLFIWTTEHLKAATAQLKGQWIGLETTDSERLTATRITTDTRKIEAGDIYLAIVGEKFDGHSFVETAVEKGAVAAIVSQPITDLGVPQLQVEDTRLAFGQIAAYRRQQHPNLKVIALTGSSGKTTVKEMLRHIFTQVEGLHSAEPSTTLVTRGNLNNDFGVPMMLLELEQQHRYAVLELGANHVGEIAYTAAMVKPDVACILNIGTAHLGEFGGRDNIAKTKAEIYQPLTAASTTVVPFDDDYTQQLTDTAKKYTPNVIHFGWQQLSDTVPRQPQVYATEVETTALQSHFTLHFELDSSNTVAEVTLPMSGQHNVSNALAAAACAYAAGIPPEVIASGLNQATSSKGRLGRQTLGMHQIIDDTYNANPNSMRAAADVLAAQSGYKILVLGDIGELGEASRDEHNKLGQDIANKSVDLLLCAGEFAKDTVAGAKSQGMQQAYQFETKAELLPKLQAVLAEQDEQQQPCTLLFKGSRSTTMETLIEDLLSAEG